MLVTLVTVSVTISSPGMAFKILRLVKPVVLQKERAKLAFLRFSGSHLWLQRRIPAMARSDGKTGPTFSSYI